MMSRRTAAAAASPSADDDDDDDVGDDYEFLLPPSTRRRRRNADHSLGRTITTTRRTRRRNLPAVTVTPSSPLTVSSGGAAAAAEGVIHDEEEEEESHIKKEEEEKRRREEEEHRNGKEEEDLEDPSDSNYTCSICYRLWGSTGDHRICCLPCGHIYGRSCVIRWIDQCGTKNASCPQCKVKYKLKDIRCLYAPKISIADDDLQQELLLLRKEISSLKKEVSFNALDQSHKADNVEISVGPNLDQYWGPYNFQADGIALPYGLCLQGDLELPPGARVFDIDTYSETMLVSFKPTSTSSSSLLLKRRLGPAEYERVNLPPGTGAIRDVRISHVNSLPGRLALIASCGKKLSVISLESNSPVITFNLLGPAWSCAWDLYNSHYVYAGLQNGMLMTFDLRQTSQPLQAYGGLSSHPIHAVHYIGGSNRNSCSRSLITASAIGPCIWKPSASDRRPSIIGGLENQGVCISLDYCSSSRTAIASFRPRVSSSSSVDDPSSSQPSVSPLSQGLSTLPRLGTHVLLKMGENGDFVERGRFCGMVSGVHMPNSAIMTLGDQEDTSLFAYADDLTNNLRIWDLQSLDLVASLRPHESPILDVRYKRFPAGGGLLGCLSENSGVQLYRCEYTV